MPLVLDADGLNALAGDLAPLPRPADARRARRSSPRTTASTRGSTGAPVGADRIAAAPALAERRGAVVLLKGPGTVVAEPRAARSRVNPTGGAALATAGTGDVLTGIVAGFLARGLDAVPRPRRPRRWVHGRTRRPAGRAPTARAPACAGDLVDGLGRTLQELGAHP